MLYILYIDLYSMGFIGVRKKVSAQIRAFQKKLEKVYYTVYSGQMIHLLSFDGTVLEKELALTWKECHKVILKWIAEYEISKTYIRYAFADKWLIQFLQAQKEKNICSVMEFPTIPYEGELSNKRVLLEDQHYREKMADYIELCTTYSDFDDVFGIPCIPLQNGVDIEEHPLRKCRKRSGKIVLLAVAYMAGWHGYERVIEGMAQYYRMGGERNIVFRLVGGGPEIGKYRGLAEECGLEQRIEFCGELEGKELDKQYDESDLAVGSLGLYKKGLEQGAPIKLREYCSRGIPFIYGYRDTGFRGDEEYLLNLPNKDEEIDMQPVIAFYEKTVENPEIVSKMRETARKHFTWDSILEPVISFYKS